MNAKPIRISKFLSQQGICSRREAEFFIQQGWIKVNGETVVEFFTTVDDNSSIELHPKAKAYQNRLITVLLHKPIGYVSGQPEKQYRPAASLITQGNQQRNNDGSPEKKAVWPIKGLAPAGRLDIDSTGLLILTQDGRIAKRLIAPDSDVEKEYLVRVTQDVQSNQLSRLTVGLSLDNVKLAPAKVDLLDSNYFRMTLTEGRKRQIRRMCELVGLDVTGLKRVRIGNVRLGSLPVGKWRLLRLNESF
ncbi:MAG: rRNA pseudouridine synthase [Gammaproteobacteria bacterium]|nr:rRNA pseudouridine synthase [Gammaproteobacteria bacterium]